MRWEKVKGIGEEGPGKRWGHTCNSVRDGRYLYLFGGYCGKFNCHTNQVHLFDTMRQKWSQPTIKGIPPIARDSHSCTVVGDNLFVFGGTDGSKLLNDLHILDTSSHNWILPIVGGEEPDGREGHGAALVGKRLFVFGGCGRCANNILEVYYNDLYMLNTATYLWSRVKTSGTLPSPRDAHTCSSWRNKIIVIGGEDENDSYLSDVHVLDTDTLIWSKLRTSGQSLPPRAGHSAVTFGNKLFVFGGFTDTQTLYNDLYMLDIEACVWTKVATTPNSPPARFSLAGDCLDPCMSGVLVFVGGCNRNLEGLDDMHYLYTGFAKESEQKLEKLSLKKQLKLKCLEQNPNLVQNQLLSGYGVFSGRMTLLDYSQQSGHVPVNGLKPLEAGKKMFQAKVMEKSSIGYTIETVIDGKPLRGILFMNQPTSTPQPVPRKRVRQTSSHDSTGIHSHNVTASKVRRPDGMEDKKELQIESSESHECQKEADTIVGSSNPTAAAAGSFKVSVNTEPESVPLNRNGDEKNDTPKFKSLKNDGSKGEVQIGDQINVPVANYEIPRQVSDVPNSNADVLKPAADECCVSTNQGVKQRIAHNRRTQ